MTRYLKILLLTQEIECRIDVALPSSQIDEHLSRGSSTCLFAPSKSTLKTRRKRLSSTTHDIRDFGKEPECSRRRQGIRMGMSPFDVRLYYRVIDPSVLLASCTTKWTRMWETYGAVFPQTRYYM